MIVRLHLPLGWENVGYAHSRSDGHYLTCGNQGAWLSGELITNEPISRDGSGAHFRSQVSTEASSTEGPE